MKDASEASVMKTSIWSTTNTNQSNASSSWSWTKGCQQPLSNNTCMPEIWSGLTSNRMISVEAVRYLQVAHTNTFDLSSLFQPDITSGWIFTAFLLLLCLKFFLFVVVTQQFYCTSGKKHRGQCDCMCRLCCTNEILMGGPCASSQRMKNGDEDEDDEDEDVTPIKMTRNDGSKSDSINFTTERRSRAGLDIMTQRSVKRRRKSFRRSTLEIQSQSRRAVVLRQLWREADVWRSDLRARDIQLMLRMSRVIPSKKALNDAKEDDVMRVEVATYLLGSGGVVDIQLGDDFNQLYLERSQSEQEEKDKNDEVGNVKKESEEERVERETLFQNKRKNGLRKKHSSFHLSKSHPIMKKEIIKYKKSVAEMGRLPSMLALARLVKGVDGDGDVLASVPEDEEDEMMAEDELEF